MLKRVLIDIARYNMKRFKLAKSTVFGMVVLFTSMILSLWFIFMLSFYKSELGGNKFYESARLYLLLFACIMLLSNINSFWRTLSFNFNQRKENMRIMLAIGMTASDVQRLYVLELLVLAAKAFIISFIISFAACAFIYLLISGWSRPGTLFVCLVCLVPLSSVIVGGFFSILISLVGICVGRRFAKPSLFGDV